MKILLIRFRFQNINRRKMYVHFSVTDVPCGVKEVKQNQKQSLTLKKNLAFFTFASSIRLFCELYGLQRSIAHISALETTKKK